MERILQEVIGKAKSLVINQARYQYASAIIPLILIDGMYVQAEDMTDEDTAEFLVGKDIISDANLMALVGDITVEGLYDEDDWVDGVADYIVTHKADCTELWNHLISNIPR